MHKIALSHNKSKGNKLKKDKNNFKVEKYAETKPQNLKRKLKKKRLSNMITTPNKVNIHKNVMVITNSDKTKQVIKSKQKMQKTITKHFEQPDYEIFSKEYSLKAEPIINNVKKKKQINMKDFQQPKTELSKITKKRKKVKQQERIKSCINNEGQSVKIEDNLKLNRNNKFDIRRLESMLAAKTKEEKNFKKLKEPESLRERMMMKLRASRFRYLNETLYNNNSIQSKKYFKEEPDAFIAYHNGYKQQVAQWPLNPLDVIIASVKKMPKEHVIADFGCGEALLAASVPQQVHSFDLVALNDRVKACDVSHTPLLTSSVNMVVFCLSLMGTNLNDYIIEANRVLKKGGILKIAEVESRFEQVEEFIKLLTNYGFVNTWKDLSHNLFYFLDFKKEKDITRSRNKLPAITLKPCLYKKR